MATGSVSALDRDNWQLIATNTPSAAASSTFSSISGYNTLLITFKSLEPSTGGNLVCRFNSDSTAGNYGSYSWYYNSQYGSSNSGIIIHYYSVGVTASGYMKIFDVANTTVPKLTENAGQYTMTTKGIWHNTDAITSITVENQSGGTITGTIKLYGLA